MLNQHKNGLPARPQTPAERIEFEMLYRTHHRWALCVARNFLRDDDEAQDAVQEAFLKVHRNRAQYDAQRASLHTWIHRIVVNTCLDMQRKRSRRPEQYTCEIEKSMPVVESRVERDYENVELRRTIEKSLDKMSEQHRAALVLREVEGCDYEEIAGHVGCPKGTVMSRLFHARRQFRRVFAAQGGRAWIPAASAAAASAA